MFVANNSLVKTKFFFPKHSTSVPVLCCGSFPSLIQEDKLLLFWEIIIVDGKELWKMLYEILMRTKMKAEVKVMGQRLVTSGKISDSINCTYLYSPGSLWIPALFLNGLPWLNEVTDLLACLLTYLLTGLLTYIFTY